jgi:hypothetical protein
MHTSFERKKRKENRRKILGQRSPIIHPGI